MKLATFSLVPILAPLVASSFAAQSTLLVPSQYPTINAAVAAAVNGDTVLVAPGTYSERVDLAGKAITLRAAQGPSATTIQPGIMPHFGDPYYPVIRMKSGEGSSTVIDGFRITGGGSGTFSAGSGVYCYGLSPTIRNCVIEGNSSSIGGGVLGNARIESCIIRNNNSKPAGNGGGVFGRPTIVDCEIRENHAGSGAGVFATGPCTITNTIIDGNDSNNLSDGYSGAGVYGPATLIGCRITNNIASEYIAGGTHVPVGSAIEGATLVSRCTIFGNVIANNEPAPGAGSGALRNVGLVENSILWGNENGDLAQGSTTTVRYSIVQSGWAGPGNLTTDPLFSAAGDFALSAGSPAIDAGDPASPVDPDGTRADMGAYYYPQFQPVAVVRNGSGVNPVSYTSNVAPQIGTTWSANVDTTLHGMPSALTYLFASNAPAQLLLPYGELLIAPSPLFLMSVQGAPAGFATHALTIPSNSSLAGIVLPTQVAVTTSAIALTNALDLTFGL